MWRDPTKNSILKRIVPNHLIYVSVISITEGILIHKYKLCIKVGVVNNCYILSIHIRVVLYILKTYKI